MSPHLVFSHGCRPRCATTKLPVEQEMGQEMSNSYLYLQICFTFKYFKHLSVRPRGGFLGEEIM